METINYYLEKSPSNVLLGSLREPSGKNILTLMSYHVSSIL